MRHARKACIAARRWRARPLRCRPSIAAKASWIDYLSNAGAGVLWPKARTCRHSGTAVTACSRSEVPLRSNSGAKEANKSALASPYATSSARSVSIAMARAVTRPGTEQVKCQGQHCLLQMETGAAASLTYGSCDPGHKLTVPVSRPQARMRLSTTCATYIACRERNSH